MKTLLVGHILLVICCIFYLLWWKYGFYPGAEVNRLTGKAGLLFYFTALFGAIGLYETLSGITQLPSYNDPINAAIVVITGFFVYIFLMMVSTCLFHRQVTTELALIIAWTVLEAVSINRAYSAGNLTFIGLIFLWACVILFAFISFILYMVYYLVAPMTGFVLGTIPIMLAALNMLQYIVICLLTNQSQIPGSA